MHSEDSDTTPNCKLCMLPKLSSEHSGSYLFASLHCMCEEKNWRSDGTKRAKGNLQQRICKSCKKQITDLSQRGGFTGFLFQDFRCQCSQEPFTRGELPRSHQATLASRIRTNRRTASSQAKGSHKAKREKFSKTESLLNNSVARAILTLKPGQIINKTYRLLEPLGEGGMSTVFKAEQISLGRVCALKFLAPSAVSDKNWQLLKNEANTLKSLSNPGICAIYDFGIHASALPFIAIEYIEGITLEELIERQNTLSLGATLEIFTSLATTLAYAHRNGIVHKDVKPGNIMLSISGDSVAVKLLDFGISEFMTTHNQKESATDSAIIGSAYYMSPEQFRGEALSAPSDIYGLGCSLYQALTGHPPFEENSYERLSVQHQNEPVHSVNSFSEIVYPKEIDSILNHALEKNQNNRYQNMGQFAIDCQRLLDGKPLQFAPTQKHDDEPIGAEEKSSTNLKWTSHKALVATIMILSAALASAAYFALTPKEVLPEKLTKITDTDDSRSEIMAIKLPDVSTSPAEHASKKVNLEISPALRQFIDSDKPISVISKTNHGKTYRAFYFPDEISLGTFSCKDDFFTGQGKQIMPSVEPIVFNSSSTMNSHPELYERFDATAIRALTIRSAEQLPRASILHLWKNLKQITFIECTLPDPYLREILNLNVDNIRFAKCKLNCRTVAKSPRLEKLTSLSLDYIESPTPILNSLENNKTLEYLSLEGLDCSENQIAKLRSLKRLNSLNLAHSNLSEYAIKKLYQLKTLTYLDLTDCKITTEQIKALRANLPKLDTLVAGH